MEITREYFEREGCFNFSIRKDNQILNIIFGGNLDLYWNLFVESDRKLTTTDIKREIYEESRYIFEITKENYFIYSLFDELYNDIKDSKIFVPYNEPKELLNNIEDNYDFGTYLSEDEINKSNNRYKERDIYQKLFDDNEIKWHSDDDYFKRADRIIIRKTEDAYILEFIRPKISDTSYMYRPYRSISIRFRNSGSMYEPYNIIFMRMFNKLQAYDPNCHQMHIEELTYQKKLSLKK